MRWYLNVLYNYFNFKGRARRSEYWSFTVINVFLSGCMLVFDRSIGTTFDISDYNFTLGILGVGVVLTTGGMFWAVYTLGMLIPSLSVTIRRLHDVGKNGWMLIVILIPIIGLVWLLALLLKDGTPGMNIYGLNPKEAIDE